MRRHSEKCNNRYDAIRERISHQLYNSTTDVFVLGASPSMGIHDILQIYLNVKKNNL